jgi:HD-GYP domain-containing protein (c-di-GMP phosphodiesterase class II)
LSRPVAVSARELGSWLGLDSLWLERLAHEGELPASAGRKGYSFDPRSIYGWMIERKADLSDEGYFDLGSLREISMLLAGGERISAICEQILDRLLRVLGAECGAIFLSDDEAWLEQVASSDISEGPTAELLSGVAVWAAANGEPLLLPDPRRLSGSVHLDEDIVDLSTEAPRDAIAVPLVLDDRVLGVLVAMRGRQSPSFARGHLALATVLATELALAVERSRAQEALNHRLSTAQTQLEAYARDVRELFAAEKQRSQELQAALGEVRRTYLATVRGLAAAVEAKDEYTAGHLVRVTRYGMSMLSEIDRESRGDPSYEYGFLLHDVGKLGIPDRILAKDGPLTGEEWSQMRRHPEIGVRILAGIPFLEGACAIVSAHHERWDGTGYPHGLRGENIPMGARLFAVADAFDAMTTNRPYRCALPIEAAIGELRLRSGSQFWPDAVDALLSLPREMLEETTHSGNGHRSR